MASLSLSIITLQSYPEFHPTLHINVLFVFNWYTRTYISTIWTLVLCVRHYTHLFNDLIFKVYRNKINRCQLTGKYDCRRGFITFVPVCSNSKNFCRHIEINSVHSRHRSTAYMSVLCEKTLSTTLIYSFVFEMKFFAVHFIAINCWNCILYTNYETMN